MPLLKEPELRGNIVLSSETIANHRLPSRSAITQDLLDHEGWDGSARLATAAIHLSEEGSITSSGFILMGSTDPKRVLASTVFGKEAFSEDYQIAFGRIDLSRFAFTNPDFPTRSMFLAQDNFEWSLQRPSKSSPGSWRPSTEPVPSELYLGAWVQPWLGLKLKVSLGLFPPAGMSETPTPKDFGRFPMIDLTSFLVEFSPKQKDMVGIPVMPYIIDPREDHEVMPTSWEDAKEGPSQHCLRTSSSGQSRGTPKVHRVLGDNPRSLCLLNCI